MKIIKWLFIIFVLFIVVFIAVGLMLPTQYSVSRSVDINSASDEIHKYVGDLKMWDKWQPWTYGDPSLVIKTGEKTTGVGASQSWKGKDGSGELKFTKSDPKTGIEYDMFFDEGKYKCKSDMKYNSTGSTTEVIWTMSGNAEIPVLGGYFALLVTDGTGPMFEKGLANLKTVVEKNKQ